MSNPKVSLIIPTYQREEMLCNTITYALNQDYKDYEILVIDQTEKHSSETSLFLNRLSDKVRIINHRPASLPGARNRGIYEARGEIVLMIDDDVIIREDFIRQHVSCYSNGSIDSVTGRIIPKPHRNYYKVPLASISNIIGWLSPYNFQGIIQKEAFRVAGGNFSVKKSVALKLGLFDERYTGTAWGEEFDFSLRLNRGQYKILYNPEAFIIHLHSNEGGCSNRSRHNLESLHSKTSNMMYFIKKNKINSIVSIYLALYLYRQFIVKKENISLSGIFYILKGHISFINGMHDGFKRWKELKNEF